MRPWWLNFKRGWFVWNPGSGGGGGGTVTTDGVTIQGNGSGGSPIALLDAMTDGVTLQGAGISASKIAIKAVQTDATLSGAGTVGSPLSSVGPTFNFFSTVGGNTGFSVPQNQTVYAGFLLPYRLTFSKIGFYVVVGDGSNNSDVGIYNAAGNLVANIGPTLLPTTFSNVFATLQGSQTIAAGLYVLAATTTGTALQLGYSPNGFNWTSSVTGGVTTGGTLNATTPAPTRADTVFQFCACLTI